MGKVWTQSIARRVLLRQESQNPSIAASSLFKRATLQTVRRFARRRRPFHRGNPAPALVGAITGGLPKIGQRVDPKKHAQRRAAIDQQAALAMTGSEVAAENLARIAQGLAWPGQWGDLAAYAGQHLALVEQKQEALEMKRGAVSAAAERRAAAAAARESKFLEAGTTVASAIGQAALSRGRRLPRRRQKRRRY
ncbi:MAG: hypothetical protein ACRDIC_15260 [bacterium]